LVKLNKVSGFIKYFIFIVCWGFIIGSSIIVLLASLLFPTSFEVLLYYSIFILMILVFQYVFINLIALVIYKISKNNILINKNQIEYKGNKYDIEDIKLYYWKFTLRNLFDFDANRLLMSFEGEGIELGRYSYRKIKEIKKESNFVVIIWF